MQELPISSRYRSRPTEPVSEEERSRLNERLNHAFADGGLDEDGYRARMDLLFSARTLGELVPVVQGLPPLPTHDVPAIVTQQGRPGDLAEARRPAGVVVAVGIGLAVLLVGVLAVLVTLLL